MDTTEAEDRSHNTKQINQETTKMKGIVPRIREILLGSAKTPKATRGYDSTLTSSNYYEGMDEDYRWFRQDELVRRCLVTNAYFSTLTTGFDTSARANNRSNHWSHMGKPEQLRWE